MCNSWCLDFVRRASTGWSPNDNVVEIGSLNVNGSPRDVLRDHKGSYLGIDIAPGACVDLIKDVDLLETVLPSGAWDVAISTEMLEHVKDWRMALYQMARLLKIGGWLVITTRSPGFEYHPYPLDCHRFTIEHMMKIFNSWPIMKWGDFHVEPDTDMRKGKYSGVGVWARRGHGYLTEWHKYLREFEVAKP